MADVRELLERIDAARREMRDPLAWEWLYQETRSVIEAAVAHVGVRSECTCALCRALAAWAAKAEELTK